MTYIPNEYGESGRLMFKDLNKLLKHAVATNNKNLANELLYEYKKFPQYLKSQLVKICVEMIPNIHLIHYIYNRPYDLSELLLCLLFMCEYCKTQDHVYTFYNVALQRETMDKNKISEVEFNKSLPETMLELYICCCNNNIESFIQNVNKKLKNIKLMEIYKYTCSDVLFLCVLGLYVSSEYKYMKFVHAFTEVDTKDYFYTDNHEFKLDYDLYKDKQITFSPTAEQIYKSFDFSKYLEIREKYKNIPSSEMSPQQLNEYKECMHNIEYNALFKDSSTPIDRSKDISNIRTILPKYIKSFIGKIYKWSDINIISTVDHISYVKQIISMNDKRYYLYGPYKNPNNMYNEYNGNMILYKITGDKHYKPLVCEIELQNYILYDFDKHFNVIHRFGTKEIRDDIETMSQHDFRSFVLAIMLKNLLGNNNTFYGNIVKCKGKIKTINNSLTMKDQYYIFSCKLYDEVLIKTFTSRIADSFDFIKDMISIYLNKLDKLTFNFIGNDAEKKEIEAVQFIKNKLAYYSNINNWIF